ncbi:hypothetical protein PRK78_005470 [Emydomyces testavorans]|uniref:BTB domain-containing protein n=1 Tax=Emydomyces testavorans TaxID=2070801 RepID=A0AAF0DKA7_9EURO|nr:hypothetical protein PRK78_005470 [Emydomyces testavorans]
MVDVIIGDDVANSWHLHEALLCETSAFFKAAFQSAFQEAKERKVRLPEEENHIFALFVQWLYSGNYATQDMDILIHTYILGDRLQATHFATLALSKIFEAARWSTFTPKQAAYIGKNTVESCALRRLVVDTVAYALLSGVQYSPESWKMMKGLHNELFRAVSAYTAWNAPGKIFNPKPLETYLS